LVTAVLVAVVGLAGAPDAAASQSEPKPSATIGHAHCQFFNVWVDLDNEAMPTATTFTVLGTYEDGRTFFDEDFEVPAGRKQRVGVPLPSDSRVLVRVVVPGGTDQSKVLDCHDPLPEPQASIGEIDCATLTVPVTFTNPRPGDSASFGVLVMKDWPNWPDGDPVDYWAAWVDVPPGESRVTRVPLEDHAGFNIEVTLEEDDVIAGAQLGVSCTALDPRVSIGAVDCATLTVPITIDNTRSAATALVGLYTSSGGRQDEAIVVSAEATKVVPIAVPNHQDFFIQVVPINGRWSALQKSFDVECDLSGEPTSRPSATARPSQPTSSLPTRPPRSAGQLPRTGGLRDGVLLVGLALVCCGAVMRLLAKSRD
jgi:hypothetical protein